MQVFRDCLLQWWRLLWSDLLAYQKRYVENSYRDDNTWAFQFGTKAFQCYEWSIVLTAVQDNPDLKRRLHGGFTTALQFLGQLDYTPYVGRAFLEHAFTRISRGPLLIGDGEAFFESIFDQIATFLRAEKLPYRATTIFTGLATPTSIAVNSVSHFEMLVGQYRDDKRWQNVPFTSMSADPAIFVHEFDLQIVDESDSLQYTRTITDVEAQPELAQMAIAIVKPQHAKIGPTIIESVGYSPVPALIRSGRGLESVSQVTMLAAADEPLLQLAWTKLQRNDARLRPAAKRLARTEFEIELSEAIVEITTALEAAVGGDAQNELMYRISLYAARLVAADLGESQKSVYEALLEAFRRRARVLRGRFKSDESDAAVFQLTDRVVRRVLQLRVADDPRLKSTQIELLLKT